jgi:hypothetical protein
MELHLKKSGKHMMLTRDEQPLTCPVATRVLIPGRMANTLDVNQAMCGSHCALFKTWHNEITDKWHVKLCQQEHIIDGQNVEKTSDNHPDSRSIFSI